MGSNRRSARSAAVLAGAAALAVVTVGCSGGGSTPPKPAAAGGKSSSPATTPTPPATPDSVAKAFLAAWASGDYPTAADLTDDSAKAAPRLAAVMKSLAPQSVQLTLGSEITGDPGTATTPPGTAAPTAASPGAAPATTAPTSTPGTIRYNFSVVDTFAGNVQWPYTSALSVIPASGTTPPQVHWSSAVIDPQLGDAAYLKALPPPATVVDDKGVVLTATAHPSLAVALKSLAVAQPSGAAAPTALQIEFVDANGAQLSGAAPIPIGTPGATAQPVATTLDNTYQSDAELAVAAFPNSGMVVIKPSTGGILAMATNDPGFPTMAYHAQRPPGSTFKVITTAALLGAGVKPTDPADCSASVAIDAENFHNDTELIGGRPNFTLTDGFEQSCNTSFINLRQHLPSLGALSDEAKTYFGLNQPWNLGLGTATYCAGGSQQVPPADGEDLFAEEMFGQGHISMCPLTMASVAATVDLGTFKQPILLPGQQQVSATPLPAGVDQNLQTLMRGVITNGTAVSLKHISPTLGAKTGSAETDPKSPTDSWMIAFDPAHDIAVGALVQNGGFGNAEAGPEIAKLLAKLGIG